MCSHSALLVHSYNSFGSLLCMGMNMQSSLLCLLEQVVGLSMCFKHHSSIPSKRYYALETLLAPLTGFSYVPCTCIAPQCSHQRTGDLISKCESKLSAVLTVRFLQDISRVMLNRSIGDIEIITDFLICRSFK